MSDLVQLSRDNEIAVIVIDNPPVNVLSQGVRAGIIAALTAIRDDAAVKAVVLGCAGRTFCAGADISEFGKPPQSPSFPELVAFIEASPKPVIAALHGTPLGGGLEVALACHARTAAAGTRLGLPEIKLGLIPGSGGTQRLPRLVGVDKALAMILSGDQISVTDARDWGLVDEIVEGDLIAASVAFARRAIAENRPLPLARDREDKLAAFKGEPAKFDEIAAAHLKRGRGLHAPAAAVEAVRGAIELPFDQALARDREKFIALRDGEQSKAQRHVFFAEREAAKVAEPAGEHKPSATSSAPPSSAPAPWAAASPCASPMPAFRFRSSKLRRTRSPAVSTSSRRIIATARRAAV